MFSGIIKVTDNDAFSKMSGWRTIMWYLSKGSKKKRHRVDSQPRKQERNEHEANRQWTNNHQTRLEKTDHQRWKDKDRWSKRCGGPKQARRPRRAEREQDRERKKTNMPKFSDWIYMGNTWLLIILFISLLPKFQIFRTSNGEKRYKKKTNRITCLL